MDSPDAPDMAFRLIAALGCAPILLTAPAHAAPTSIAYRTFHYVCDAGKKLDVTYVNFGAAPTFAVLAWKSER